MSTEAVSAPAQTEAFIETARDLFGLSGSSWEQFRRYATEHLRWCEEQGIEVPADAAARAQYREHLEASGKVTRPRHWTLRATAINKLPAALAELRRQAETSTAPWRTRLIDGLPAGSELRQGIEAILGDARGGYRASMRADLALLLEWCQDNQLDAAAVSIPQLAAFQQWLQDTGRRSRGPLFAARRLRHHLHRPLRWWAP